MNSDVKVEFEHRTESHPIKLVSEYVIRDIVQAAVGCASIASGKASSSTGVAGARYRHTTDHSANCSASTRPARRRDAGRFGKMPTTSVRRRISLSSRPSGLFRPDLLPVCDREAVKATKLDLHQAWGLDPPNPLHMLQVDKELESSVYSKTRVTTIHPPETAAASPV